MTVVLDIPLKEIHFDNDFNCRGQIAPIDVADLARNIEANGLLNPINIQEYSAEDKERTGFKYILIAGYCRFTAFKIMKRDVIPCNILSGLSKVQQAVLNLSENLKRRDLNILQEARAIARLKTLGVGRVTVARELGVSENWVQVRFALLDLPEEIQVEAAAGILTQHHVKILSGMKNKEQMFEAVKKIKDAKVRGEKAGNVEISRTKTNPNFKRHRKRPEIFDLMNHIAENVGMGFHTRVLAWAAGEITTVEVLNELQDFGRSIGKYYIPPSDGNISKDEEIKI